MDDVCDPLIVVQCHDEISGLSQSAEIDIAARADLELQMSLPELAALLEPLTAIIAG